MKRKTLFNVSLLAISNVLVRIGGLVYKIWLAKAISPVALGIYQLSMSLYSVLLSPVASGLPNGVSRLSAKYKGEEGAVLSGAFRLALVPVALVSLVMLVFNRQLAAVFLHRESAGGVVLALLPAVTFGALACLPSASLHGQGKSFLPAMFEIVEQVLKILFAVLLLKLFVGRSDEVQAQLPALAVSFGGVVSFVMMLFAVRGCRSGAGNHRKELMENAVPPSIARLITSLTHLCNTTVLPLCLIRYGLTEDAALSQYGILTSMAYPVVYVPMTVIGALCVVTLPQIAGNLSDVRYIKHKFASSAAVALSVSLLFSLFLLFFAPFLLKRVFGNALAGRFAVMLIPSVIFLCLSHVCRTVLNGLGKQKTVMATSILDGALGVLLTCLLVPAFGIYGFIIGNCLQDIIAFSVNFLLYLKEIRRMKKACAEA